MKDGVTSVGLAGDGDEVSAIFNVENAFNIKFDYDEAPDWITAGDLFASLKKKISEEDLADMNLWGRFALALSQETGVNPKALSPESPLILEGHSWLRVHDALSWLWITGLVLIGLAGTAAFILG